LPAKIAGLVHLGRPFADADREYRAHARFLRASQHRLSVVGVARTVQVGMGIYKHLRDRGDLVNLL
jgi:hypothetical protein